MKRAHISQGGQIQVPAEVRRRWGTSEVLLDDRGASLVVRPMPADPIGTALGSLAKRRMTSDDIRRQMREEESHRASDRER